MKRLTLEEMAESLRAAKKKMGKRDGLPIYEIELDNGETLVTILKEDIEHRLSD